MDDSFEQPTASPQKLPPTDDVDEQSSDDEDGELDWTKL
jgi:hypothetical protein